MGRLLHSIKVLKPGAKMQLRIEMPSNIKRITGVLPVINSKGFLGHQTNPNFPIPFTGSLWLRCSDKRDVFYAENVKESLSNTDALNLYSEGGFLSSQRKWSQGKTPELFSIDVPVKHTIIEGYFEDTSLKHMKGYTLEIYLTTEL